MKNFPLYKIVKKKRSIGLLCNQSAWDHQTGKYIFQLLAPTGKLKRLFIPEHGLFGELQDQVKLNDGSVYNKITDKIEWVSLYSSDEHSLAASASHLNDLDMLIIDIQDVGSRYYTYTTTTWLLLKKITELNLDITVVVSDKPNPAGRSVEGTRLSKEYSSFIGLEGLPHRHGLTMGELCGYFRNKLNGKWELIVDAYYKKQTYFISPSPNIPSTTTCTLYSGQCLWEGTNISEGRGTTLPFETIGAPFLDWVFAEDWNSPKHPAFNKHCGVRPLKFVPVFHKFASETCSGIQLMVRHKEKYHSLSHSLQLIRYFRKRTPGFEWREGKYEAFNDKKAIELLIGDQLLLDYTENKTGWKEVKLKMDKEEKEWIKQATPYLIYKPGLQKLKIN
jgi:uncharacterized protein YbbC (DUF1343 family)